jgi:hypothetical protein
LHLTTIKKHKTHHGARKLTEFPPSPSVALSLVSFAALSNHSIKRSIQYHCEDGISTEIGGSLNASDDRSITFVPEWEVAEDNILMAQTKVFSSCC